MVKVINKKLIAVLPVKWISSLTGSAPSAPCSISNDRYKTTNAALR